MLQQLLHSYFQNRGKADRQGQKIQHSCSKVSELHLLTSALSGPFSCSFLIDTLKEEVCGGFAVIILNISNYTNLH